MSAETSSPNADAGRAAIAWARRSMPLSTKLARGLQCDAPCRIGLALPLDPATSSLALWLAEAGLEVTTVNAVSSSRALDLIAAMSEAGVRHHSDKAAFLGSELDIILDTDGSLLAEFGRPLVGGSLCSPRVAAEVANVSTRVVHIAAARFIENSVLSHGIGQACVSGLLDITNLQIAGAEVLVLGYEAIGEGAARYASAYGARVIVCEDDPVSAVKARMDGHLVMAIDEALPKARVVFNTRQEGDGLNLGQLESLPSGAFLCSAISDEGVSPFAGLQSLAPGRDIRDFVTQHDLPSGRDVKLVCGGMALHNKAARGLPLEFADILMAAQLWSIAQFINPECSLLPGLQPLSSHIEEALAEAFLDID